MLAIDDDLSHHPAWMQGQLSTLAARASQGAVHALPVALFDAWRSYEAAFRLLQSGSNIGKVVLWIPSASHQHSHAIAQAGAETDIHATTELDECKRPHRTQASTGAAE